VDELDVLLKMKIPSRPKRNRGAIPLVVILIISFTAGGGALGWMIGGGADALKSFAFGAGIGLVLGLLLLPNLKGIIRWWKGIRSEIKRK